MLYVIIDASGKIKRKIMIFFYSRRVLAMVGGFVKQVIKKQWPKKKKLHHKQIFCTIFISW